MLPIELEKKVDRYSAKFELLPYFEKLFRIEDFDLKPMFGGLALYGHGKMLFCIMEDPTLNQYKDKKFDYPIWNGLLTPTFREYHETLFKISPDIVPHPVLGKWIYIPQTSEHFEEVTSKLVMMALRNADEIGIIPKGKKKKAKKKTALKTKAVQKKSKVKKKKT